MIARWRAAAYRLDCILKFSWVWVCSAVIHRDSSQVGPRSAWFRGDAV